MSKLSPLSPLSSSLLEKVLVSCVVTKNKVSRKPRQKPSWQASRWRVHWMCVSCIRERHRSFPHKSDVSICMDQRRPKTCQVWPHTTEWRIFHLINYNIVYIAL